MLKLMKSWVSFALVFVLAFIALSPASAKGRKSSYKSYSTYKYKSPYLSSYRSSYSPKYYNSYKSPNYSNYYKGYSTGFPKSSYSGEKYYKSSGFPENRSSAQKEKFLRQQGLTDVPEGYEVDHIVPLSVGGVDDPSNMQLLPKSVHQQKTNMERKIYKWNKKK